MVCLNLVPCRFGFKETLCKLLCFMFLIHFALMEINPSLTYPLCESVCKCDTTMTYVNCSGSNLTSVPKGIPKSVKYLVLSNNTIPYIINDDFSKYHQLLSLQLDNNKIKGIDFGAFKNLQRLKLLNLSNNEFNFISSRTFSHMTSLSRLILNNNKIKIYEDGAFLFLPNISKIELNNNVDLKCGCHLPALVKYMRDKKRQTLNVTGRCRITANKTTWRLDQEIQAYCGNYTLFQHQYCQCSGTKCSQTKIFCQNPETVCKNKISVSGVTLKFEKSCGYYSKCIEDERNNMNTCNDWTNGTTCISCCKGPNCNYKDFIGWTYDFFLNLTLTVNISFSLNLVNTRSKEYYELARNISNTLEEEFSNLYGSYSVKVNSFANRPPKEIAYISIYCIVPIHIDELRVWYDIYNILKTSTALDYLNIERDTVNLTSEKICNAETISTDKGTFDWAVAKAGTTAKLPCYKNDNVATRTCLPKGEVFGSSIWGVPILSKCYYLDWVTRALRNMSTWVIDKENIEKTSKELLRFTWNTEYFQKIDIVLCIDILENMMPWISNISTEITTKNILQSINNIINCQEETWVEAQESNQSAKGILDMIERIPNEILLKEQQLTASYPNLGIGVSKVDKNTFNGLSYSLESKSNGTEVNNKIYNTSYIEVEDMTVTDFISLPESLLKHLKHRKLLEISRVSFHSLRTDKLYRVIQTIDKEKTDKFINSQIIAANIPNIQITKLERPITISFSLLQKKNANPHCVYWDESSGEDPHWSTKGCNIHDIVPGERVSCSCNHLTSFALLMDIYGNEEVIENGKSLSLISIIGCGISFVCLILTIMIHLCSKILRKAIFSKILINLCTSLAIANFIFLVGMRSYATKSIIACKAVAALLHYFLMVAIMWMAVEACQIYLGVFVVFNKYKTYYMLKSTIISWGVPAIIVILTLAINYTNNYTRIADVCWLTQTSFYIAFLFPVVTILIFNLTIFSLIIGRLIAMKNDKKFEHKAKKVRLFGIAGVFFLLGLSWILAFFTFGEAAVVFKYLFTIFNTLQGLFIFIFYCIYKREARDVMCKCLCAQKKNKLKHETKYKTNTQENAKLKQSSYTTDSDNVTSRNVTSSTECKTSTRL